MNKDATEDTHLKVYEPGEAFGELALLYNAPRAVIIKKHYILKLLLLLIYKFLIIIIILKDKS